MGLSTVQIGAIARQVYRQFPEVKDVRPVVQSQSVAKGLDSRPGSGIIAPGRYILTFRGRGKAPGGQSIPRIIRVVADERGKVLKISTSR